MSQNPTPDTFAAYQETGVPALAGRLGWQHGMSAENGYLIGYAMWHPTAGDRAEVPEVFVTSPIDSQLEGIGRGWCVVLDEGDGRVTSWENLEPLSVPLVAEALLRRYTPTPATLEGENLPQSIVHLTASMPYGYAAGKTPRTVEGLVSWLTGLRSVLTDRVQEVERQERELAVLLEQRAAMRAFLGTGE